MTNTDARNWVRYWTAAKMIRPALIAESVENAAQAIKYTQALRVGVAWNLSPKTLRNAVLAEIATLAT